MTHWKSLATLILLASLLTGCASIAALMPHRTASHVAPSLSADEPAFQATSAAVHPATAPALLPLRRDLAIYLAAQTGTYGVFVIDVSTGATLGINQDTVFPTASTFKLPMSLYLLDQAAQGRLNLDERLAYSLRDFEEGTGVLQTNVKEGDLYPVRRLIELAITHSDNIATNMLMRRFGFQNVYAYMHQLGGQVTKYDPDVIGSTPREMALYMQAAQGNALRDTALTAFLMDSLARTVFADRIVAGAPEGVHVAHKIGTLDNVINDVGLVSLPGRPVIIAVMSMGVDTDRAPAVIEELTRRVCRFFLAP
ncbi:MAG TPA: serine hydrolase [Symbiobacteriaceae bacterium]|nr:serine hydrolase [Symbiobacteriaceae bacterium]